MVCVRLTLCPPGEYIPEVGDPVLRVEVADGDRPALLARPRQLGADRGRQLELRQRQRGHLAQLASARGRGPTELGGGVRVDGEVLEGKQKKSMLGNETQGTATVYV